MNKHRLLEIAEYISLISSVAGSFAAMALGQVAYATTPLSLSILLNLVNRHQFERQTRQSANDVITKTHQQISADIQSLRSCVLNQSSQFDLSNIEQSLLKLTEEIAIVHIILESRLTSLSAFDAKPINEEISQLNNQYANLLESLDVVRQQLNIEPIQNNISLLREKCITLQSFLDALVYRMLSDGSLSSRVCSDEMESKLSRIIEYYREQRERRRQKYPAMGEPLDHQGYNLE